MPRAFTRAVSPRLAECQLTHLDRVPIDAARAATQHSAYEQALTRFEPALRTMVKRAGFLTRDPRVVERKKYGRAKARRSFQFSKR